MKKMFVIFILIAFQSKAQKLTLEEAINIALKNSFDIQLAKNNVDASTLLNNYGVAGGLPTVSATANDNEQVTNLNQKLSNGTNTNRSGVAANNLNAGLTGSILLYNGMRVVSTKKRLEQLQQQNEQLLNVQIQNTIALVMTQYYDVVRQQSYLKTLNASIDAAVQRLEIVKTQQFVGLANDADLFQSQLDLNALQQNKQAQQVIIDQAKTDFLTSLNLKPDSTVNISDTILTNKNILLDSVLSNLPQNPLIIAADRQININQLIEKETAAQRYPSLRFNTGFNYNRSQSEAGFNLLNQTYGPTFGLNLSIPIYNGSAYKRQQKVAEIDTKNAILQKESLLRDNASAAVKTHQAYSSALQQLESQKENYRLAQQLLDLVLKKFELRNATIVEVKNAQQTFENAGFLLVNLSFASKSAEIELKRLSNRLDF
ncbi:MAG: TolC family protein [Panacibacter sp.]